jgi:hypothetical protein
VAASCEAVYDVPRVPVSAGALLFDARAGCWCPRKLEIRALTAEQEATNG